MTGTVHSYILVGIQFACLIAIALTGPIIARQPLLFLVEGAGIALGIWAIFAQRIGNFNITPDVRKEGRFVAHGPYARIRHPMYSALILVCGALVIDHFTWLRMALLAGLAIDLVVKLQYEESLLLRHYPQYAAYQAQTKRLVPYLY